MEPELRTADGRRIRSVQAGLETTAARARITPVRRPWANLRWRLRLSTLIFLNIILAMGLGLVIQQRREQQLLSALRAARSPNDEAIHKALDEPIDWQKATGAQTLDSVLKHIKLKAGGNVKGVLWSGIPIYVDPIGLQEAGKSMNSPVTVPGTPKQASPKAILEQVLAQLKLDYVVKDGFLMITSKESVDKPVDVDEFR